MAAVTKKVPHLMTLADLSPAQIQRIVAHSYHLKRTSLPWLAPQTRQAGGKPSTAKLRMPSQSLFNKSIALLFSKRSTRTRLSAETCALLLGGQTLFLSKEDIQLGVNETVRDSARVIGGFCQGIFARVGEHEEIEVCTALPAHRTRVSPQVASRHSRSSRGTHPCPSSTRFLLSGIQLKCLQTCLLYKNTRTYSIPRSPHLPPAKNYACNGTKPYHSHAR